MTRSKEFRQRGHCRRKGMISSSRSGCFLLCFLFFSISGWGRCLWCASETRVDASSPHLISRGHREQYLDDEDDVYCYDNDKSLIRQRQFLSIGRSYVDKKIPTGQLLTSRRNDKKGFDEVSFFRNSRSRRALYSEEDCRTSAVRTVSSKIPTPWPLNVIQERLNDRRDSSSETTTENEDKKGRKISSYPSMGALFFAYAKQQARIGFRQVSEISSQILFHFPPSTPPLILLASMPRNVRVLQGSKAASTNSVRRIIPLFSDPFARSVVLAGLGLAVVSWSNQELQRKRKLTPLPLSALSDEYGEKGSGRVSRVFLPPFLPEVVPEPEIDALRVTGVDESNLGAEQREELAANEFEENILSNVSPKIRRHLNSIYKTTTTTSRRFFRNYFKDWQQGRAVRKREVAKIRRNRIYDELVALQALKKRQTSSRNKSTTQKNVESELGYALVTGASRGIGRAIAVELARWEIPLVLVARDAGKLAQLASDLEACYGVRCCVLEADLSKADAAEKIHQATTEAGISVDILVNNAGVSFEGLAVDSKTSIVENMITLNSLSYAKLGVLYGQEMKKKRRGRILMMSSMVGLCHAAPNIAVYGACKAFCKSLALSMAKEMEHYGVGVTCLIPGAVSDTNFRDSSGTRKALCWYLPFYPRSPDMVAHQGVLSLFDGDTQSVPGWQNRIFSSIVRPMIPQRLEVMIVQLAFTPLQLPSLRDLLRRDKESIEANVVTGVSAESAPGESSSYEGRSSWLSMKPRYTMQSPPRFLKLPEDKLEIDQSHVFESKNETLSNAELSSLSPQEAHDNTNAPRTDINRYRDDDTDQVNSSVKTPEPSMAGTENKGSISETEPETVDLQSHTSFGQHGEGLRDEIPSNLNNSDSKMGSADNKVDPAKIDDVQTAKTRFASGGKDHSDYGGDKSRVNQAHNSDNIAEGKRVKEVRSPQWFRYYDEDEDDEFSTSLGPITSREDERDTMLSKQMNIFGRATKFIIV